MIYFGGRLTVTFGDINQVGNEQARKGLQSLFSGIILKNS